MSNFVKTNKIAISLWLVFIGLALVSGFYLKSNPRSKEATEVTVEKQIQPLSERILSSQTPVDAPTTGKQPDQATTTIKAAAPVAASSEQAAVGEQHILTVNDKQYAISLPANQTVYDLMLALKNRGDFDFKGKGSAGLGWFVEEINGVKNNSFKNIFWFYYVNGQSASVGISNYILKPNDLISWKYETAKF
jgi:hypothetical protein